MKKIIILSLLLVFIGLEIAAQSLTSKDIVGIWKVVKVNVLEEIPDDKKQKMEILEAAFLKSKFEFKEDKYFSFDFELEEMKLTNTHWKYNSQTEIFDIQDWKDKDTSESILMGINARRQNDKIVFFIPETFIALEVEKLGEDNSTVSIDWKSVINEKYQFDYPNNWSLDTSGIMGTSFFLFSQVLDENDQFRENINLLVQDLTAYNLNLDQYIEVSESQIRTVVTEGKIILSERKKGGDREFQKVIYSGKQGIYDLQFEQYIWMVGTDAYILTLTCELSEFEKYQEIGEKIMDTFELK